MSTICRVLSRGLVAPLGVRVWHVLGIGNAISLYMQYLYICLRLPATSLPGREHQAVVSYKYMMHILHFQHNVGGDA